MEQDERLSGVWRLLGVLGLVCGGGWRWDGEARVPSCDADRRLGSADRARGLPE
jgi:hypothetical protein